jgi:hypothetical protein
MDGIRRIAESNEANNNGEATARIGIAWIQHQTLQRTQLGEKVGVGADWLLKHELDESGGGQMGLQRIDGQRWNG